MEMKIALAGNPNSGKTTLFNALTGSNQYVGNWPGVTVEKKEGKLKSNGDVTITDLPGIYSLSPYTPEEVVARNYLLKESPDAIINIVDGMNIERNLYLTTQLTELSVPVVLVINFMDIVRKKGDKINIKRLSEIFGCPVFEISALKGTGVDETVAAAISAAASKRSSRAPRRFSGTVEHALAHIEEAVLHSRPGAEQRWYAVKLFERDRRVYDDLKLSPEVRAHIEEDICAAEEELGDDAESIIANERYNFVTNAVKTTCVKKSAQKEETSDKIDRILMNRFLALPLFAAIMFAVYYVSVSIVGSLFTDFMTDTVFGEWIGGSLSTILTNIAAPAWLSSLLVDGILGGVGSVLSFVPQIIALFIFLSMLEECGYMSRIAFILDKLFRKFGLSGKSFIPLLVSTGCGVPGIMASRTIENEKERRITIMTATFMPCGAKLPVIYLIAGAMFGNAGWVAASAYLLGIASVAVSGIILKKTKGLSSKPSPFVMELPPYHMPAAKSVIQSTWDRTWSFIKKAGTVILVSSVIIWLASNFGFINGKPTLQSPTENSILAAIGEAIAWIFTPLGFGNWKSAVAVITGLAAKENIVATLGVLYGFAAEGADKKAILSAVFTPLSAYAFLVFNLLCAPCVAAVAAIFRELRSVKQALYAIGYQTGYAYTAAFVIYQIGRLVQGDADPLGSLAAIAVLLFAIWWIFIKGEKREKPACTGSCASCKMSGSCHIEQTENKKT